MYLPESKNGFIFFINYDIKDVVILVIAILLLVGFIIYRKKYKRNKS